MKSILLNNWKFHYNDCPEAWYKGYSDNNWEEVSVPHDWSVHMPFSKEYSSGTGYLAGGIGWYRTAFQLPEALKGKRVFITFDGVYKNSQVWCNSYYLGQRPFGYATFRYDITDQVIFGTHENIIAVKVDHQDIADSRWFTGSGITRKVTVTLEESVHYAFQGIFFKTPDVTKDNATILIENNITNDSSQDMIIDITSTLSTGKETSLAFTNSARIPAGSSSTINTEGILNQPALWCPESPNLYNLTTTICAHPVDNSLVYTEEYQQKVGIRQFQFHPDHGFFLNNHPYKLKGVCVHHDAGCLGAAVTPEVWLRRLCLLKEMGCNALRMSHNPHMPELYDLCDTLGFFVMDEAFDEWEGPKNKWSTGHNVYPPKHQGYYEAFPEWHERDLSDFIKRDRNHPSIIAWSIGNEIDYPNDPYCHPLFSSMTGNNDKNKPSTEMQFNPDKPNAERLSKIAPVLVNLVKEQDSTRPVTAAVAFPELSTQIGFMDSLDIVGYNYKEQFYAKDHLLFPDKPFLGSENSHSYQAWKAVRDQEYISGQFLWTGIDYLGEAHGWPIHGSAAGIITLAGFEKTSYYRRKSFWAEKPMLYLTTARAGVDAFESSIEDTYEEWKHMNRSWDYLEGELVEVRCYTNLPLAELYCNGVSQGKKEYDDEMGCIRWFLPYELGEISVMGSNPNVAGGDMVTDSITCTGAACDLKLKLWNRADAVEKAFSEAPSAIAHMEKNLCFTDSLKQIEVTVTDAKGNRAVNDSSMLLVEVIGPGALVGLENGDLADGTEYFAPYRRAHEGRLVIYVTASELSDTTTIKVSSPGLKSAMLEF